MNKDQKTLMTALELILGTLSSVSKFMLGEIKKSKAGSDLSASLLVDVDTYKELIQSHLSSLLEDADCADFNERLLFGVRLGEELFSKTFSKFNSFQRLLSSELGLDSSSSLVVQENLNEVNANLNKLLSPLANRYEPLAVGLLGV